jgi:hypothetical protein
MATQQAISGIPRAMRFGLSKVPSIDAHSSLRMFASGNGTVFNQATNEIRISVSAGDGFLDVSKSYLQFQLANLDPALDMTLSSDAGCWIDQVRIESNGQLLERIDRMDLWASLDEKWNTNFGQIQARQAKAGGPVFSATMLQSGTVFAQATSATFCIPLKAGLFHTANGRAIPQGAVFDIIIRCKTAASAFTWETANAANLYSVTNPRFYCPQFRLGNSAAQQEYNSVVANMGVAWSGRTVKTYIGSMTAVAATQTIQINDRSQSLLGLVAVARLAATLADATASKLATVPEQASNLVYRIDGRMYPQDSITCNATTDYSRVYEECQRAMALDGHDYSSPSIAGASFIARSWAFGVDLRHFSDDKLALVGLNTAASASPSVLEWTKSAGGGASDVTIFAICEARFMYRNGQLSASV